MRLQLTVQRHGLPPVQVLWTIASVVRPPLLAAGNSITISQFLEQVNEVLPLESEHWGLEDYSVEVHGFECLHFSELNQVLKDDDEVCIRPLQTQDLRFRKISGRHQIAADGKHLIDGVAFGRPYLRRAERPALRIPPRKRRRIAYDDEDDFTLEKPNDDRQIVIRAGFDNADGVTMGDESDDEEDFAPDDEEEDDLDAELDDLHDDLNVTADADDSMSQEDAQPQRITRSQRSPKGLGLLKLLDGDGRPFVGNYSNPLLDLYGHYEAQNSQPESRLRKRGSTDLTRNSSENIKGILRDSSASPQRVSRRDSAGSNRSVRFENAEPATPATVQESEDSEDAEDGDFELGEFNESDKENAEPHEETDSSDSFLEGSQSSSSTSSDDQLSEDETSSSGSSPSSSSSDSESEQPPSKDLAHKSEMSETSSSGSSSSSSDSEPEPPKNGQNRKWAVHDINSKTPEVTTSAPTTTSSGNGSKLTRSRNKRRRESKKLSFIKRKGILPATASKSDLHKFEEGTTVLERQEMIAFSTAFEAKRQDLLKSINSGGVDVTLEPSPHGRDGGMTEDQLPMDDPLLNVAATQDTFMTDQPASEESIKELRPENPSGNHLTRVSTTSEIQKSATDMSAKAKKGPLTDSMSATMTAIVPESDTAPPVKTIQFLANDPQSTPGAIMASKSIVTSTPESPRRRSKLDMSGAKRMLFGSLGLRTPKTKDDEMKTREKLMKDVRPVKEPHVNERTETVEDIAAAAEDDSWKDKINLRAVECCYEGIELSTPPFPFVQRWDPQQQRGYSMGNAKKRKGKKRKRNKNDYYEDSSSYPQDKATLRNSQNDYDDSSFNLQNKVRCLDEDDWYEQDVEPEPSTEKANAESNDQEHSHDEGFEDSARVNQQLLHETEDASADTLVEMEEAKDLTNDLPTLPEDISICSSLTLNKAAKGNIVAFKQLEMSAETNWQPNISEYRTAIVDEILDDGTLSMTLAKRDQTSKYIRYDEQTGERIYSKFEMPGYHDEIGEDRNGKIAISFDELINPVLIEAARGNGNQSVMLQGQNPNAAYISSINEAITDEAHDIDASPPGDSPHGPIQEVSDKAATEASEEVRQEISELIRDAGWRSSINHALIDRQDEGPLRQNDDLNDPALVGPPSPKFQYFSSSPLANGLHVTSSSPAAAFPTSGYIHASRSEIAESVSPQNPEESPARSNISNGRSAIDYPDLPQMNDDSEVCQQEAQERSGLLEVDHQITSQDLTSSSSIRRSPSPRIASPSLKSSGRSSPEPVNVFDGADSDESLPELFSQAFEKRMSQGRDIKSEPSEEDSISPPSRRKAKRNSRINSSQRESNCDWEPDSSESEHDEGGSTPRQSQPIFSSQIVDLTISSDTVDLLDESYVDDDSYVLPKGPGWVQKPRTSEPRDGPTRKPTRGSMRSR